MSNLPPPNAEDPAGAPPPPSPSAPPNPPLSYPPPGPPQQPPAYPPPGPYQQPPAYPPPGPYQQPTAYPPPGPYQQPTAYPPPGPYQQPPSYPPPYGGSGYLPPGMAVPGYPAPGGWVPGRPAVELASYGARLGGWVIDFIILVVVYAIVGALFRAVHVGRVAINTTTITRGVLVHHHGHLSILALLLDVVILLSYGALFCGSSRGQTPGMMAVSVRAVDASSGGRIGYARALGRAALEWVLWVALVIPWIVDMVFPLWDVKHQTLHDKASGTVVVKAFAMPSA